MRVIIIREDNAVVIDGERHIVDCSDLPTDFHALQWDGEYGEIEHSAVRCSHCGVQSKKHNEMVFDMAPYKDHIDRWHVAKAEAAAKEAEEHAARSET